MTLDGVVPFPRPFAEQYRAAGYWQDRLLIEHYEEAFAAFADRVAIIDEDTSLTYAELQERSFQVARNLYDAGIRTQDRVIVQLTNTALFPSLYIGLQHLGAIPILALPSHRFREIEQFARLSGAVALVSPHMSKDVDFTTIFRRVADQSDLCIHLVQGASPGAAESTGALRVEDLHTREPAVAASSITALRSSMSPEDPAVFLLSGGTTGIPKLIPRTHNDYAFNSKLAASVCDIRDNDVLLDVLPISHNLPLACPGMQGFLFSGASVSLVSNARAEIVFERLARDGATHMHLVPALLIKLLESDAARTADVSSMRVIQSGGQRLQPEIRIRANSVFRSATVQENFGMAEGLLMFVRLDDPEDVRLETVGRPVCPHDEVKLVDEAGEEVADGEIGELWARGPYTLRGYFRAPEHNARSFSSEGFYMSGDLMWKHPSGNFVVAGRKKDLINRGGEKISAEEIENLILTHPLVVDAAIVPYPDAVLGERMCACLILSDGASLELSDLVDYLAQFELARHKLPERLRLYTEFPLSPIGKVSKKDLVAELAAEE